MAARPVIPVVKKVSKGHYSYTSGTWRLSIRQDGKDWYVYNAGGQRIFGPYSKHQACVDLLNGMSGAKG